MIYRILVLSVASVLLISCALAPRRYPTKTITAKLYNLTTGEVHDVTAQFDGTGHGEIDFTLPSGDHFTGQYNTVTGSWGRIYGGIYTQTFPTDQRGVAIMTSQRNRYLHCEYVTNASYDTHGHGACVDNDGTMYRLMW